MDFVLNDDSQCIFGLSTMLHAHDLVRFCKGWHKFFPFVGACVEESLHEDIYTDNQVLLLTQRMHEELINDQIHANIRYDGDTFSLEILSQT